MDNLLNKLDKMIEVKKKQESALPMNSLMGLTLSEFSRRHIAVEVYSEVLQCNLWLCSDDGMKAQVMRDAPGQVCYTARELLSLLKLNPSPEDLMKIHEAKEVFPNSKLLSTNKTNKGESD